MHATDKLERALEEDFGRLSGYPRHDWDESAIVPLYGGLDGEVVLRRFLGPFIRGNAAHLKAIYRRYGDDPFQPELLRSPVSIVVFECLSRDRFTLRQRWLHGEDMASLERMSDIWGASAPFSRSR